MSHPDDAEAVALHLKKRHENHYSKRETSAICHSVEIRDTNIPYYCISSIVISFGFLCVTKCIYKSTVCERFGKPLIFVVTAGKISSCNLFLGTRRRNESVVNMKQHPQHIM